MRAVEIDQQGAGPDLLLIHSLLTELTVFDGVVPGLARTRRVTRINLPGFGKSAPVELNSLAEHAAHVANVMRELKLSPGTEVFGNGFGAFVALQLALDHGAKFGPLVVADALAAFPEPARAPFRNMAQAVRSKGMEAVLDTAIGRMLPPGFQEKYPQSVMERKQHLKTVDAACFARACLALAEMDLTPRLASLEKPTLVMCGALDQTTPPALARELAAKIPRARYREIPDSGHCPMLEQPQALVAFMMEFLDAPHG